MNREDIIRMAREVGLFVHKEVQPEIERFAALVAAAAKAEEREACAKVCDGFQDCGPENGCCPTYWNESLERAAAAIQARGETK